MLKITVIVVVIFFLNTQVWSQANNTEAAMYNIGFGMVTSSIGAVINKPKGKKTWAVVRKALWQGALGGALTYGSKHLIQVSADKQNWRYVWPAKILSNAGASIKENAALNRDFWEQWNLNIGFNRIEFHTKDKFKIRYKLMPVAFYLTIRAFVNTELDYKSSLKFGEFYFLSDDIYYMKNHIIAETYNGLVIQSKYYKNNLTDNYFFRSQLHEEIHLFSQNDFEVINTYLNPVENKYSEKNKLVNFLTKTIYPRWSYYLIFRPLYLLEERTAHTKYDNFFEHEAGYYSNTL